MHFLLKNADIPYHWEKKRCGKTEKGILSEQRKGARNSPLLLLVNNASLPDPYHPCMVYLPAFTINFSQL